MKKYIAGALCFNPNHLPDVYYTDDFEVFHNERNKELTNEDLEEWAIWLNSPWSQMSESYTIAYNCDSAYTRVDSNKPLWKCEYAIVGYERISATVMGYGDTESAALEDCKKHFQMLQDKYNTKNESV